MTLLLFVTQFLPQPFYACVKALLYTTYTMMPYRENSKELDIL